MRDTQVDSRLAESNDECANVERKKNRITLPNVHINVQKSMDTVHTED